MKINWCLAGRLVVAVCMMLMVFQAYGAGFALTENSASSMGNAFAGVSAVAQDASTIYFNPAGMTRLHARELSVAGHYISPEANFNNRGSTAATGGPLSGSEDDSSADVLVPNLYFVDPLSDTLTAGVGLNVPFGLTTEYDDNWVGRYHGVKSDVRTVNINPSIAWRATDHLSLGAGVSAQYIDVKLSSAVDLGSVCLAQELGGVLPAGTCSSIGALPQQKDGFADLKADNWSWGFNLGLLYAFNPHSRVGLAYRSKVAQHLDGAANFTVPGELAFLTAANVFVDTHIKSSIDLPENVSLSLYHELTAKWAVLADWTWTRWSRFDELRIRYNSAQPTSVTTENWNDANRYSLGVDYQLNNRLLLRGGLAYDETPVPNARHRTPRIPGNDRRWVSLGLGYHVTDQLSVDAGYAHLFISESKSNHTFESGIPTLAHTLKGEYTAAVDIFSVQLNWRL